MISTIHILIIFLFGFAFSEDWDSDRVSTDLIEFKSELFSDGYTIPWGMAFLPDQSLLVTDISGILYHVNKDGANKVEIKNIPKVYYKGQGGLLDVEIHPDFKINRILYLAYSDIISKTFKDISCTAIAKAKLLDDRLIDVEIIYKADVDHYSSSPYHFGSRIVIDKNHLYFSIGDRGSRGDAQNVFLPNGKIHRINLDGSIPKDNPFKNKNGELSSVYCYGNRNPQGLTLTKNGILLGLEHGPKGGDELNLIEKGNNYGWPLITYGVNYSGTKITDHTHMDGMEQPIWHWTPSIAVCGMKEYIGDEFKAWEGNILVTSLKFEYLERVVIKNKKRIHSEIVYRPGSRVRDVEIGPDRNIFVALENPGRIVRLYTRDVD